MKEGDTIVSNEMEKQTSREDDEEKTKRGCFFFSSCKGEAPCVKVSDQTLSVSSAMFLAMIFWFMHVVPQLWKFLVKNNFITSVVPFAAKIDQFVIDPYRAGDLAGRRVQDVYDEVTRQDSKHLFALLGSLTHMVPFILGVSCISLFGSEQSGGKKPSTRKTCKYNPSLKEIFVGAIVMVLPFTFFSGTYFFFKFCFEHKVSIVYSLAHHFFVGQDGGTFAYMASCSYTSVLLLGYLISVASPRASGRSEMGSCNIKTTSTGEHRRRDREDKQRMATRTSENDVKHDVVVQMLPRVATFFVFTFVLLHFVGIPLWEEYTGPLLRSHGRDGFTRSLPMLASATHSLAFIFGLSFVWCRQSKQTLFSLCRRATQVAYVLAILTVIWLVRDPANATVVLLAMIALPVAFQHYFRGPAPGNGRKTSDHVWKMPRLDYDGRYEPADKKRRRIDAIRKRCGNFPPPSPNGWYRVMNSVDLPKGAVKPAQLCGREMVAFRTTAGVVGVLDAFCPHLGTHLGHGGTVENDTVVCPYHKWSFDTNGRCQHIPYCPNSSRVIGRDRVNTRSYRVSERAGMIFVWFHVEDKEPFFRLSLLDEIEDPDDGFFEVDVVNYTDFLMHAMEPAQNTADWYHFRTVHSWLPISLCGIRVLKADHSIDTHYGGGVTASATGRAMSRDMLVIRERIDALRLFGIFPIPSFLPNMLTTEVQMNGCPVIMFRVNNSVLGRFRALMTITPVGPFRQRMQLRGWANGLWTQPLARLLMHMIMLTVEQDRQVWEHKVHVAPRNLVAGDGPFGGFGAWMEYFYSKKSWGDAGKMSSDW